MSDTQFVDGLIVKAPNPKAPDFVKASISIQPAKLISWLEDNHDGEEWVNIDVKESRGGKWYAAVNTYKRQDSEPAKPSRAPVRDCPQPDQVGFEDDPLPF